MIRLAISSGDPLGISYEVLVRSFESILTNNDTYSDLNILGSIIVFGSKQEYLKMIKKLNSNLVLNVITKPQLAKNNQINLINCCDYNDQLSKRELQKVAGKLAYLSLKESVKFTKSETKVSLITAPVSKSRICLVAANFTGHTNYLKEESKLDQVVMLFWSKLIRLVTLTHHIPLKDVGNHLTYDDISQQMLIVSNWLKRVKIDGGILNYPNTTDGSIKSRRKSYQSFAMLSINPHSGEGGLLGLEEEEILKPALAKISKEFSDFKVSGPYAADSFFAKNQHIKYDAVFATYHDQGLIPAKLLAKDELINQTLGLPYIRTSPSHGTADDIAGKLIANHSNMLNTIMTTLDQNITTNG